MERVLIGGIQKFSTSDGPGIRTTVFVKGCPLRCAWCHNPELIAFEQQMMRSESRCIGCGACVDACPNGAIAFSPSGEFVADRLVCEGCLCCVAECYAESLKAAALPMLVEEIMEKVLQDKQYYQNTGGGVTLSGGEILSHPHFAQEMIDACGRQGIGVVLDTSGHGDGDALMELARQCTGVLFDIKSVDDRVHQEYVGVSNASILQNLSRMAGDPALKSKICVRIPLIGGVNDGDGTIVKTAALLAHLGLDDVNLLPYHELGVSKTRGIGREPEIFAPPDEQRLAGIRARFEERGVRTEVLGRE